MIVAVASGKGGTGKTTVAVNLALSAPGPVWLVDCDVEEPNCRLFLHPEIAGSEGVGVPVPEVDSRRCTACGKCTRICRYHAIVALKDGTLVFPELCHGCLGCIRACPVQAIRERSRLIGTIERGRRGDVEYLGGHLNVGEAMAVPMIRALKRSVDSETALTILDAPPGTSCPVVATVRGSDFVLLVTEPTPFGFHDLSLAVQAVRKLRLRFGVVVNRADIGTGQVVDYCAQERIPVLLEIPDDRQVAEAYSRGEPIVEARPAWRELFLALHERIQSEVKATHLYQEERSRANV